MRCGLIISLVISIVTGIYSQSTFEQLMVLGDKDFCKFKVNLSDANNHLKPDEFRTLMAIQANREGRLFDAKMHFDSVSLPFITQRPELLFDYFFCNVSIKRNKEELLQTFERLRRNNESGESKKILDIYWHVLVQENAQRYVAAFYRKLLDNTREFAINLLGYSSIISKKLDNTSLQDSIFSTFFLLNDEASNEYLQIHNLIAKSRIVRLKGNYEEAMKYCAKASEISKNNCYNYYHDMARQEIATIQLMRREFSEALALFLEVVENHKKRGSDVPETIYFELGKCYHELGFYKESIQQSQLYHAARVNRMGFQNSLVLNLGYMISSAINLGDTSLAKSYLRESLVLLDDEALKEEIFVEHCLLLMNRFSEIKDYKTSYTISKKLIDTYKVKPRQTKKQQYIAQEDTPSNGSTVFLVLILSLFLIIVILIVQLRRIRPKTEKPEPVQNYDLNLEQFEDLINSKNWFAIYEYMERKFPEFSSKILSGGILTESDRQFCALIKLNFSNFEISNYMGISNQSVRSAKFRIKKKLDIPTNQKLDTFLKEISE
ncbi:MAG: hypothetical protein MRY83_12225 [Flavobacteriales bacterium]|nr:hypothetical protein [Flavobacteriales bacterium]